MPLKQSVQTQLKPSHVCKWKRHTYETGSKIFFCSLPKCNKKIKIGLALGKECICWRCGEVFSLNEYSVRLAKPHCTDCHKSKDNLPKYDRLDIKEMNEKIISGADLTPIIPLSERLKKISQVQAQVKEEDEEL